ncbi:GRAM domain-containing protein [Haloplasma contractile]|uniref:GRAM domain-containing protein n=1 Tax=Haloplasma contractile SSD-17B TaxID=1033810 RepID=U2FHJ7_9MOLU|nr:GRAM domain-containing protein [Haloplasma contractile]ERJ12310.1 hypothetical protein HLPCO_001837 [Haloplasma contractile SSD-17B]
MMNVNDSNFKFFIRTFLLSGIPFGSIMSIFYMISDGFFDGIGRGILGGIFFGFLMALFNLRQRKKFKNYIEDVLDTETVIYDGEASSLKRFEAVGGWLFLTSDSLLFKSHKLNIQTHETEIDIREIATVTTGKTLKIVPNKLIIEKIDGKTLKFTVNNRKVWVEKISELIN